MNYNAHMNQRELETTSRHPQVHRIFQQTTNQLQLVSKATK
jgi:hypothetical protein